MLTSERTLVLSQCTESALIMSAHSTTTSDGNIWVWKEKKKSPVQSSSVMLTRQTDSSPEKDGWLEEQRVRALLTPWSEVTTVTLRERRMKKTTSAWAVVFVCLNAVGEVWFSEHAAFDQSEVKQTANLLRRQQATGGETHLSFPAHVWGHGTWGWGPKPDRDVVVFRNWARKHFECAVLGK